MMGGSPGLLSSATIYATVVRKDVLVAGLSSGHLAIWESVPLNAKARHVEVGSAVYSLTLFKDDTLLACGCDQFVAIYAWPGLALVRRVELPAKKLATGARLAVAEANATAWDGSTLWIGAGDGRLYAWDPATETLAAAANLQHDDMVLACDVTSSLVTSASEDGAVKSYDPKAAKVLRTYDGVPGYCAALHVDPTWITVAGGVDADVLTKPDTGFVASFHKGSGKKLADVPLDAPCRDLALAQSDFLLATDRGVVLYDRTAGNNSLNNQVEPLLRDNDDDAKVVSPATIALLDDPAPPTWGFQPFVVSGGGSNFDHHDNLLMDDLMDDRMDDHDFNGQGPGLIVAGSPALFIDLCTKDRRHRSLRVV
mmetsp:Transcript_3163/g.10482  ORF Transcript_3163/g.10482 Transcript_3163/m.10482 type:complete len:368 (-) Transcript_3163:121-1224(-)